MLPSADDMRECFIAEFSDQLDVVIHGNMDKGDR